MLLATQDNALEEAGGCHTMIGIAGEILAQIDGATNPRYTTVVTVNTPQVRNMTLKSPP
jgi:hypothetical protein